MRESGEMYLETILVLSRDKKFVRSIDIADKMGFSKASVSRAVSNLKASMLIDVNQNGYISLTPEGATIAERIYERHSILTDALIQIGVDPDIASADACKIEHDISDESIAAIKNHLQKTFVNAPDTPKSTSKLKINCIGASNSVFTLTTEKEKIKDVNFPIILGLLLRCTVRVYAKSGTNIAVHEDRNDSYLERMTAMDTDADVVVIQGGGNDYIHATPLGIPGERNPNTYCGAIALAIDYVREKLPKARLIVLTSMKKRNPDTSREDGATKTQFNEAFTETCRKCGIEPVNFWDDEKLDPLNPESLPDGTHMSEQACRHYADVVADVIKNN